MECVLLLECVLLQVEVIDWNDIIDCARFCSQCTSWPAAPPLPTHTPFNDLSSRADNEAADHEAKGEGGGGGGVACGGRDEKVCVRRLPVSVPCSPAPACAGVWRMVCVFVRVCVCVCVCEREREREIVRARE